MNPAQTTGGQHSIDLPPAGELAGWPALPQGFPAAQPAHNIAAVGQLGQPGSNVFMLEQNSAQVDAEELTCTLTAGTKQLSWAMYQFSGIDPNDLPLVLTVSFAGELPPGPCYVGVSDYAHNRWNWTLDTTTQAVFNVAVTAGEHPLNPNGYLYLLVGVWDGMSVAIREAALTLDAAAPPPQGFEITDGDGVNMPVQLSWIDPAVSFDPDGTGPEQYAYDGIEVQRALTPTGPWVHLTDLAPGVTEFMDQETIGAPPLVSGRAYYEVRTLKTGVLSPFSFIRFGEGLLAVNQVVAKLSLSPAAPSPGATVTLNGSASIHSGTLKWIVWDFDGNGVFDLSTEPSLSTTHVYPTAGRFYPRLKLVMDTGGGTTMTDIATGYLPVGDARGDWSQTGRNGQHTGASPLLGPNVSTSHASYSNDSVTFYKPAVGADGTVYVGGSDLNLYVLNPDLTLKTKYTLLGKCKSAPAIAKSGHIWMSVEMSIFNTNLQCVFPDLLVHNYAATTLTGEPVISTNGEYVYAANSNELYCATPENPPGSLNWYIWKFLTPVGDNITTPAVAADGSLYFGAGKWLYHISGAGKLLWKVDLGDTAGTPSFAPDGKIMLPVGGWLMGFSNTGTNLYGLKSYGDAIIGAPAITPGGTVYASAAAGHIYAYALAGYDAYPYYENLGEAFITPPVLDGDGRVYALTAAGNLYCLTKKLTLKWSYPLGESCADAGLALGNNGQLYIGGCTKLTVIKP